MLIGDEFTDRWGLCVRKIETKENDQDLEIEVHVLFGNIGVSYSFRKEKDKWIT
jgi:hypothetical protein